MIARGYINANRLPRIKVKVIGGRASTSLEAIIDTGFDGDLCIPIGIAVQVGLTIDFTKETVEIR